MVILGGFGNQGGMRGCEDIHHSVEGMRGNVPYKQLCCGNVLGSYTASTMLANPYGMHTGMSQLACTWWVHKHM
jgi:hypothetical protein